jgi:hypothetical protein
MEFSQKELLDHIREMNQELARLRRERDEARWLESPLKERTRLLNERIKEMACAYEAVRLLRASGPLEAKLEALAALMPASWQHARFACARILLDGREFRSPDFGESPWRQAADVVSGGRAVGRLEVFYAKELPAADEGPFLKEERMLLAVLAECVGLLREGRGGDAETATE